MLPEAVQHIGVESAAGSGEDHLPGLGRGVGGLIDPGMDQGVKGVRQPHNMHPWSDMPARQSVRIPLAVPTLMVMEADVAGGGEVVTLPQFRYGFQQFAALCGVRFYNIELLRRQRAGLV